MKKIIKLFLPPILLNIFRKCRPSKEFWKGDYSSWEDALLKSTGYDADQILQKVKSSLLKVKNGEAVYERDSVLFDEIQYSWPLLAGVMMSAKEAGKLSVVDFGGSLGSSYFQNKKFLDEIDQVSWNIVEQKHFVETGRKDFENERLKFYYTISECMEQQQSDVLLLSGVLQYIENPYDLLEEILKYNFKYIIIDRIPFNIENRDRITLQTLPPSIYDASYPCRFFAERNFKSYFLSKDYSILEEFSATDGVSDKYYFKGIILKS